MSAWIIATIAVLVVVGIFVALFLYQGLLVHNAALECYDLLSFEPLLVEEVFERVETRESVHINRLVHSFVPHPRYWLVAAFGPNLSIEDKRELFIEGLIMVLEQTGLCSRTEYNLTREEVQQVMWWNKIDRLSPPHRERFLAFIHSRLIPEHEVPEVYADSDIYQYYLKANRTIDIVLVSKKPGGKKIRKNTETKYEMGRLSPAIH